MTRVAVVTGGASGIGLGVARRFAVDGHSVAVLDCNGAAAKTATDEFAANGSQVLAVEVDVADRESVRAAFNRVRSELGPVEIMVATLSPFVHVSHTDSSRAQLRLSSTLM